jgi:hypothetical protein
LIINLYIYKITENTYIGSTVDYRARWSQQKEAGEDMPFQRAIKAQRIEKIEFGVIKNVKYRNSQPLLIYVSCS